MFADCANSCLIVIIYTLTILTLDNEVATSDIFTAVGIGDNGG